jgi:hypothetical protein
MGDHDVMAQLQKLVSDKPPLTQSPSRFLFLYQNPLCMLRRRCRQRPRNALFLLVGHQFLFALSLMLTTIVFLFLAPLVPALDDQGLVRLVVGNLPTCVHDVLDKHHLDDVARLHRFYNLCQHSVCGWFGQLGTS